MRFEGGEFIAGHATRAARFVFDNEKWRARGERRALRDGARARDAGRISRRSSSARAARRPHWRREGGVVAGAPLRPLGSRCDPRRADAPRLRIDEAQRAIARGPGGACRPRANGSSRRAPTPRRVRATLIGGVWQWTVEPVHAVPGIRAGSLSRLLGALVPHPLRAARRQLRHARRASRTRASGISTCRSARDVFAGFRTCAVEAR